MNRVTLSDPSKRWQYEHWDRFRDDPRIVDLLRQSYLQPPSSLPYNLSTNPLYINGSKSYGWLNIKTHIEALFGDQRNGFFIEAGALDGEYLSNTLWLEMDRGWGGLLIEPDENSYRKLLSKHRKTWSSNTCISMTSYPLETIHVGLYLQNKYTGNPWNYRGSSHIQGISLGSQFEPFLSYSEKSYQMAQCFPLISYLKALNISTVDLLSLDLQGIEQQVLRAIPFNDLTIRVIIAELTTPNEEFHDFLTAKGFVLVNQDQIDFIYAKEDDILIKNHKNNFMS
ncbi:protein Star-like [Homarus americanus]|uniref:protein Star-like n=1 Tax=Homarus americanus TaxID=6706 RepID=UPI001C4389FA|nr:protein Star-like [Homarus americanus]